MNKVITENDPEEISFKDLKEIQENHRMTINFIKMKSTSITSIQKKNYEKFQTNVDETPQKLTPLQRKSFHSKANSENFNEKLFEKFLIIGIQKKDLIFAEDNTNAEINSQPQILNPKIIYSFPKDSNEEL